MKKKYVAAVAVILVIIVVASAGYYISILGSRPPVTDGTKVLQASNDSMAPTIKNGAQVTYNTTVPFSGLQVEDIIVFHKAREPGTFIGRIVNATVNGLVVKGDNNPSVYLGYITEGLYAGKVEKIDNSP